MKKFFSALLAAAVLTVSGATAFAQISTAEAEGIVKEHYPDARIHYVKTDWDHGRLVYEVKFSTGYYVDSEMEIDAETGRVLEIDLDD